MSNKYESLSHTKWECKYHVVFISKCRRRNLYGQLRQHLDEIFLELARQKQSRAEERHLISAILPKFVASQVVGYIKVKSVIQLTRVYGERKRNFVGQDYWARGYFDSTVGRDEEMNEWNRRGFGNEWPPTRWINRK